MVEIMENEYYEKLSDIAPNSIVMGGFSRDTAFSWVEADKIYKPGDYFDNGIINGYVEFHPRIQSSEMCDIDDPYEEGASISIVVGNTDFHRKIRLAVKTDKGYTIKSFKTVMKLIEDASRMEKK